MHNKHLFLGIAAAIAVLVVAFGSAGAAARGNVRWPLLDKAGTITDAS
jgi:hypothetical protein